MLRGEAINYCLGLGAYLAEFNTCSDFVDIIRALDVAGFNAGSFWTGAVKFADLWSWETSGASLVYGAPYWTPFVPLTNVSDCAVVDSRGSYMEPSDCFSIAFPMCETPAVNSKEEESRKAPKVVCQAPFTEVGGRCFYINQNFLTWENARTSCQNLISGTVVDLAVLSTCDLFTDVVRFLEESETGISEWLWVGANDYQESGVYRWLSGDFISPGVPLWCPGQPNNFGENQNCAMLWGKNFYYLADEECTSIHRSVCEIGV
ncbi:hypothetical protein SK128_026972 [Halocaridina rubra]|uniref:C-type lectin domain-containing protein n=1 Tax=Halocaridina rubra TaxID=373956 RepID=A0AAN8WVF2_HALRR